MLLRTVTGLSLLLAVVLFACLDTALWVLPLLFLGAYVGFVLIAAICLWLLCVPVNLDKPQEHDSRFYRSVIHIYIEALVSLALVRLHTKGLENTPKEGRFLLVCNHLFVADPAVLLHCFPKSQLAFLTKKENYNLPIVGKLMHKILCQPIDRENDRQSLKTILKCIQLLKDDQVSVGAFPEGYTSKDGKLHPFRPGVFKIAQKAGVPIVVCTIQNTRQLLPNLKRLKHTDIELHLVDVIPVEALAGKTTVAISDMVYEKMIADLGEEVRYIEN